VLGITDTRNAASVRLLQRAGFRAMATLPAMFRGEPCLEQHFVRHRPGRAAAQLRAARTDDARAVAQVLIDSRAALLPFAPSAHDDDDVRGWVAGTLMQRAAVTVAEVGGAIAGVLATSRRDDGAHWIEQLMLRPEHVGAGIGAALLAHALAHTGRPLRLWTFQPNLHARAFYERHGFVAVKFTDGDNEEGVPDVMYER
jgi:GNAT superfamily N-acetyltransferase